MFCERGSKCAGAQNPSLELKSITAMVGDEGPDVSSPHVVFIVLIRKLEYAPGVVRKRTRVDVDGRAVGVCCRQAEMRRRGGLSCVTRKTAKG